MRQGKHFHFIGIGGVGMGALASLMLAKGYRVSGSDLKESLITTQLKLLGAQIFIGHNEQSIGDCDYVIYSSAIRDDNPEVVAAKKKHIPLLKRAQLLAQLFNSQIGIAVAGAHGKTTTSSMISCLLIKAGLNPTTAVGGLMNTSGMTSSLGAGKYFVAEVDESDGTFLHFSPHYSVITNIDFEHLDYYHTWKNILSAYRQFIRCTKDEGYVIACGEDRRLHEMLLEQKGQFMTYGFNSSNDIFAQNIMMDGYATKFECVFKRKILGQICLNIPGRHNILNALACLSVGLMLSIDFDLISESLKGFSGVKRRFQVKADVDNILVIDDYGHHPTEITATLQAARSLKKQRVVCVFQPHRYTRTMYLMEEFVKSLSLSDYLIVTDIYAASEKPIEGVTSYVLYEKIRTSGHIPVVYLKKEEILDHLSEIIRPGDLIITLGAGDINRIADDFAATIKNKSMNSVEPVGEKIL